MEKDLEQQYVALVLKHRELKALRVMHALATRIDAEGQAAVLSELEQVNKRLDEFRSAHNDLPFVGHEDTA